MMSPVKGLPQGWVWVYPKKGTPQHGYAGRHAFKNDARFGDEILSVRQVQEVQKGKKTIEQALETSNKAKSRKDARIAEANKTTHDFAKHQWASYIFPTLNSAHDFLTRLPQQSIMYVVFGGILDTFYQEADDTSYGAFGGASYTSTGFGSVEYYYRYWNEQVEQPAYQRYQWIDTISVRLEL